MRTIETTATITEDGQLTLQAPPDLSPGQHRVVIVIDEQTALPLPQTQVDPLIGLFSGSPELGSQSEHILQSEIRANTGDRYLSGSHAPLPRSVDLSASGRGDLSERDEELLWQETAF